MSLYPTFTALRDALAVLPGLAVDKNGAISCKVGKEVGISPDDYPLIRIVPVRAGPGKPYGNRTSECDVYFGVPTEKYDSLETIYENTLEMEQAILDIVKAHGGRYLDTLFDQDQLAAYKMLVVRCEITGAG